MTKEELVKLVGGIEGHAREGGLLQSSSSSSYFDFGPCCRWSQVEWKLSRGQWRPLLKFAQQQDEGTVRQASEEAFKVD